MNNEYKDFPKGYNPYVCPNCKSDTFERSQKYWETCIFDNTGNNGIWYEQIDSDLDDSYESNMHCVECGEIVNMDETIKQNRVILMRDELNIYPKKLENNIENICQSFKIQMNDIISSI